MQKAEGRAHHAKRFSRSHRVVLGLLVMYWVALVVGTHWPGWGLPTPVSSDLLLHFSAYFGLACLLALVASWGAPWRVGRFVLLLAALAAFGAIDELTQPPFHRTADWFDWYSDLAGILAGLLLTGMTIATVRRAASRSPSDQ